MNINSINNNQWGTLTKVKGSEDRQQVNSIVLNNKKNNSLCSNLEKLKETLEKSREELMEKNMTPEEKKYKLEDINKQIAEVEAQIQQAKIHEKEKELEKAKEKIEENKIKRSAEKGLSREGVIVEESLEKLIEARHMVSNISNLKVTKSQMEVERGWLTPNENKDSFVTRQYTKLSKGIQGLENRIYSEILNVAEKSTESVESNVKDNEKIYLEEKEEKEEKSSK